MTSVSGVPTKSIESPIPKTNFRNFYFNFRNCTLDKQKVNLPVSPWNHAEIKFSNTSFNTASSAKGKNSIHLSNGVENCRTKI